MSSAAKASKIFNYLQKKYVLYSVVCIAIIAWLYFNALLLNFKEELRNNFINQNTLAREIKYVLIWTSNETYPFKLLQSGQRAFIEAGCDVTECYVTSDRNYLKNLSNFHAVLFHGPEKRTKPPERSPKQKYVYAGVESAHNYPVCDQDAEGFFNWTWTYKLDSYVPWNVITIRDLRGNIVGPKKKMTWIDVAKPIREGIIEKFAKRRKAAAWFVSNCFTKSSRGEYVTLLKKSLHDYGLKVDIFGSCGFRTCPMVKQTENNCDRMLQRDYYFYLAFENSFSEDYVTEKVLHGYRNHVVPVVFGSANYTRFLPPNSYLDAYRLNATALAHTMHRAILTPKVYHRFFRWTNHYTVEESGTKRDSNPFCRFCAALHDPKRMERITVCNNLLRWWNGKRFKRICKSH